MEGGKLLKDLAVAFKREKRTGRVREAAYQECGLEFRAAFAGAFSRLPPTQYRGQYSEEKALDMLSGYLKNCPKF